MINWNYVRNLFIGHRVLLITSFVFLGVFQFLIFALVETFDLFGALKNAIGQMPLPARQFLGEQFIARLSVSGAIAFGYAHPFVLVTLFLVAILLPARHVAGEIESGTLELIFSLPVSRRTILLSLWLASGFFLLVLSAGCLLGTGMGLLIYSDLGSIPTLSLIRLDINLWLLVFAISSLTLSLSTFNHEGGQTAVRAAGITLFFYFFDFVVRIWSETEFLHPITIFYYFQPLEVLENEANWGVHVLILSLLVLVTAGIAITQIGRRNIP